jgi:uncharacterized tellurite resistance protein B-like protein
MFAPTIRHIEENLQIINALKTRLSDSINKLSALKQAAEKEGKKIAIQATPIEQKQGLTLELLEDVEPDTDLHFDQRVVDAKKNLDDIESQLAYLTDDDADTLGNHQQHIYYIANILMVVHADQVIRDEEMDVVRGVVKDLNASEEDLQTARELVESGNYYLHRVGSYSDQIRILEDMFRACFSDGNIDPKQKELIEKFAGSMGIRQERMDQIQEWLPERIIRD